jgi:hypothetical protein
MSIPIKTNTTLPNDENATINVSKSLNSMFDNVSPDKINSAVNVSKSLNSMFDNVSPDKINSAVNVSKSLNSMFDNVSPDKINSAVNVSKSLNSMFDNVSPDKINSAVNVSKSSVKKSLNSMFNNVSPEKINSAVNESKSSVQKSLNSMFNNVSLDKINSDVNESTVSVKRSLNSMFNNVSSFLSNKKLNTTNNIPSENINVLLPNITNVSSNDENYSSPESTPVKKKQSIKLDGYELLVNNPNNTKYNKVYINKANNTIIKYIDKKIEFDNEIKMLDILRLNCTNIKCNYFVNYIKYDKKQQYIHFNNAGIALNKFVNLTITEIESIRTQLLEAINELHKIDIFHGDIKPENILLSKSDTGYQLKLIDFGEATILENGSKSTKLNETWFNQNYEGFKYSPDNFKYTDKNGLTDSLINIQTKPDDWKILIKTSHFNGLEPDTIDNKKNVELAVAETIIKQLKESVNNLSNNTKPINESSTSNNAKQKYLKYKSKYLELKKTL